MSSSEETPAKADPPSFSDQMDSIDQLIAQEDAKNAVYRKRMLFLIPFNFFALWSTIKYFQNVQRIAKRFWPKRQKASIGNFFLIGTL